MLSTDSRTGSPTEAALPSQSRDLCSLEVYNKLVDECKRESYNLRSGTGLMLFPSHSQVDAYVQRYFDSFDPIFPFLRQTALEDGSNTNWLLLLAVAVMRSKYVPPSQNSCNVLAQSLDAAFDCRMRHSTGMCDDIAVAVYKSHTLSISRLLYSGYLA
jgi:hypothetical protein